MGAGTYSDRLLWKQRSTSKNAQNGQEEEAFTDNGYLWAWVESTGGQRQQDLGAEQTGETALIHIRNYPAVSALDRLELAEWEELWVIEHIARGDDEIICTCHKFDALAL